MSPPAEPARTEPDEPVVTARRERVSRDPRITFAKTDLIVRGD